MIDSFVKDGTQYFELYCKCPNCIEVGRDVSPSFWYCESCGGEIYVGDNAHLYCKECGRERNIMHSAFKCPNCRKVEDEVVDLDDVSEWPHTQILIGEMVYRAGIPWLTSLLKNL